METGFVLGLVIPFLGTMLGAGAVLGLPLRSDSVQRGMNGLAAGMMLGASFGNLLVPATRESGIGAAAGLMAGVVLILLADRWSGRKVWGGEPAGILMLALVLHNIPEGMAVGISGGQDSGTMMGIALQNIPDGMVAAMPLAALGMGKKRAFFLGTLTGAVEPMAAMVAWGLRQAAAEVCPGIMGFAAGAMLYVVIRELAPRMEDGGWDMVWMAGGTGVILIWGSVT